VLPPTQLAPLTPKPSTQFLATFNSKFSLDEVEAFINDESTQPDGVLDFPE